MQVAARQVYCATVSAAKENAMGRAGRLIAGRREGGWAWEDWMGEKGSGGLAAWVVGRVLLVGQRMLCVCVMLCFWAVLGARVRACGFARGEVWLC